MNKLATIFFIFTCSFSFSQDERKIIDNFHFDVSLGYGVSSGNQYAYANPNSPTAYKYYDHKAQYFSMPKIEVNYRNIYFKIGLGFIYIVEPVFFPDFKSNYGSHGQFSDLFSHHYLFNLSISGNLLSFFNKMNLNNYYLGPVIGYSSFHRSFTQPVSSFLYGGEFYYKFIHISFTNYVFTETLSVSNSLPPTQNDQIWFINIGISFNTAMFRKKK